VSGLGGKVGFFQGGSSLLEAGGGGKGLFSVAGFGRCQGLSP